MLLLFIIYYIVIIYIYEKLLPRQVTVTVQKENIDINEHKIHSCNGGKTHLQIYKIRQSLYLPYLTLYSFQTKHSILKTFGSHPTIYCLRRTQHLY